MKMLKLALDKSDNISLSLYESDGEVTLRKTHNHKQQMFKQYKSLSQATKAFDNQIQEDYRRQGIYYSDFYDET